jgi:signal transduction histidine kinase
VATDRYFAQVVSLACHDIRTPLATVHGFARTIERLQVQDERTERYLGLISEGSTQVTRLLERLALVARIERGVYEPILQPVDTLDLARAAAAEVTVGEVTLGGESTALELDADETRRSLTDFFVCALRHGGFDALACDVDRAELRVRPVTEQSGRILIGEDLRDFGAAAARIHVEANGGSVSLRDDALLIGLPTSAAARGAGP